ncbi:hypothetical protein M422DRAFT_63664 [Sphaerobolus stellatus SS14]|nr:hypothetical protein M422DRAFT_63664 [Sphaerobolus stellatus SS14]
MGRQRQIVIDSSNSEIKYAGQWEIVTMGPTYNGLLQATTGASSFSFPFSGSSISVDSDTLEDGEHNFLLQVASSQQTFYFDRIEYQPSLNVSVSQATLKVDHTDPVISFVGSGWINWGNYLNLTGVNNSQVTFPFVGSKERELMNSNRKICYLDWMVPFFQNASQGRYTIDDGSVINGTFPIYSGSQDRTNGQYNPVFFKTPDFTPGPHVLNVVYDGSSTQALPLSLLSLFVVNDTTSKGPDGPQTTSSTSGSSPISTQKGGTHTDGDTETKIGPIVGGIVGGIIVLALCIGFWFWRRRKGQWVLRRRMSIVSMTVADQTALSINPAIFPGEPRNHNVVRKGGHRDQETASLVAHSPWNNSSGDGGSSSSVGESTGPDGYFSVGSGAVSSLNQGGTSKGSSSTSQARRESHTLQHQDSGLRLTEVPPSYTEA